MGTRKIPALGGVGGRDHRIVWGQAPALAIGLRRETVADGTMAFYFSRPPGFRHEAGQSLLLTLVDPPETDGEGNSRTFTIASAPHESELMIATRMRDTAFKRVLKTAPLGTTVSIDGPNGEMVLHEDVTRPAVFLAGGIGITPFLSIARPPLETIVGGEIVRQQTNVRVTRVFIR